LVALPRFARKPFLAPRAPRLRLSPSAGAAGVSSPLGAMRPLALVTGTSSGIGLATAIACAQGGFEVIATMRDPDRRKDFDEAVKGRGLDARERGAPGIHVEPLDVQEPDCGERVRELVLKYGPIEALVNNAGIAVAGAFEELSDRDVREQFETNVFGAMAVTRALVPSMRAWRRGRIVNVSSISGRIGFPGLGIYAATKHAVGGFSESLAHELRPFGIHVCLVEPGTVRTAIFTRNQRRGEHTDTTGPYAALYRTMERVVLDGVAGATDPEVVAKRIVQLLKMPAPPLRTVLGTEAKALLALRRLVRESWFESTVRRLLDPR
jgi:NAD(P)-dependent dehydrogenase (short-subunit alcohol dehydrogenase family)